VILYLGIIIIIVEELWLRNAVCFFLFFSTLRLTVQMLLLLLLPKTLHVHNRSVIIIVITIIRARACTGCTRVVVCFFDFPTRTAIVILSYFRCALFVCSPEMELVSNIFTFYFLETRTDRANKAPVNKFWYPTDRSRVIIISDCKKFLSRCLHRINWIVGRNEQTPKHTIRAACE
jgi:hypothetical protein